MTTSDLTIIKFVSLLPFFLLAACHIKKFDAEKEKGVIIKLESDQRAYHFAKNARAFTDLFSDHFISIDKGIVDSPARAASLQRFQQYFNQAEFIRWDNLREPVIRFSDDGSIAYVAVQKQVIFKLAGQSNLSADTTNFAWLTVYKKNEQGWKIDCVVSTNR